MANILVVDDDPVTREIIKTLLSNSGHIVFEAKNGKKGIEIYLDKSIDLVITDLYMPEKDGIETILELKSISPKVKIIVITGGFKGQGETDPVIGHITKDFGASSVLYKPIDPLKLKSQIQTLLSTPLP